jgi:hypothetical protein
MLKSIGEIPITDDEQVLTADSTSDIGMARDTLLEMSRIIQQEGYWFNTEVGYPLVPTVDGYIAISDNILAINSPSYIIKDHKLYDIVKRTYLFDGKVTVDTVFEVPFDDLPFVVADVITREATVSFYNDIQGDTQELKVLETNAQRAQIAFQKAQYKHKKSNLIKGSRLIDRTQNPRAL